jgi:RNA recognition motif-containing protein
LLSIVEFENVDSAARAINEFHGLEMMGRPLRIREVTDSYHMR